MSLLSLPFLQPNCSFVFFPKTFSVLPIPDLSQFFEDQVNLIFLSIYSSGFFFLFP